MSQVVQSRAGVAAQAQRDRAAASLAPLGATMRAAVVTETGGPEVLRMADVPVPRRLDSEVLVKVVAAGVNPVDLRLRAGGPGGPALGALPAVLGRDFSGVVVESPYEDHALHPGDEVFGLAMAPRMPGSYAPYVAVPSVSLARKPARLSHVEAAATPVSALTAWGMVVDIGKAHEGQVVLVHAGAGGVGHFAVQFARHFGARVIATGSPRNVDWLAELGADEVIDRTQVRFEDVLADVDVVIDLVGNCTDDTGTRSLPVLRRGGLIVSAPMQGWPTLVQDAAAAGVRATHYEVAPDGQTLAVIARLLESGDIRVYVDEVFDLQDAAEAHRHMESGRARGKVVLNVSRG
ncbi:NADP-dependent oxidoreductase [Clavibacter sp. Sh2036]|uniref:NADP-dependent oxidoreductase n=1 Tax=Clavibacter sp. Sh2036 TaxID=3397677 RepID=UPI0039E0D02C